MTLLEYDVDITSTEDEKYDMTISASIGEIRFDEIRDWISSKIKV